uniref:Uncharacterized protein n=1 Tax=Arundo donax TaxID=35708 RepID=A0A0A9FX95_ARUDO
MPISVLVDIGYLADMRNVISFVVNVDW